jgi:hypothetical protein
MRRLGLVGIGGGLLGALVLAGMSCGGMDGTDEGTAGSDTNESALWRRHRPAPTTTTPPTTQNPGTGGSTSSGSTSGMTTQQVIAAAQTPDGQAIPQAAGPNGTCPEVVVRLGFWSCPTIGQTCTSTNPVRHCVCSRTDGEGQNPSWICQ